MPVWVGPGACGRVIVCVGVGEEGVLLTVEDGVPTG